MSKSLIVEKSQKGHYYITVREWYFQGDRPDYTRIEKITENQARLLVQSQLATDHTTDKLIENRVEPPNIVGKIPLYSPGVSIFSTSATSATSAMAANVVSSPFTISLPYTTVLSDGIRSVSVSELIDVIERVRIEKAGSAFVKNNNGGGECA